MTFEIIYIDSDGDKDIAHFYLWEKSDFFDFMREYFKRFWEDIKCIVSIEKLED